MGAGWLKWPPDVVHDALMADILEAYAGHLEELTAIHGKSDDEAAEEADAPLVAKEPEAVQAEGKPESLTEALKRIAEEAKAGKWSGIRTRVKA